MGKPYKQSSSTDFFLLMAWMVYDCVLKDDGLTSSQSEYINVKPIKNQRMIGSILEQSSEFDGWVLIILKRVLLRMRIS